MGIVRKFIEFVRNKIITRRGFAPGTITKIMAKYILSKKAKGKKYQYTVTDEKGNVISTRTSARDYVACTANETERIEKERRENKVLPLVEMGITEAQALQYCYDRGIYWEQNGVRLYEILDRVSCRICRNKNLKELQNIKRYLPETWTELMELQNRIPQPFKPGRKNKKTGELIPGKTIHYFSELWDD